MADNPPASSHVGGDTEGSILVTGSQASSLYRAMAKLPLDEARQAQALTMLGCALSALGRWEEALRATQEAVVIHRQLAEANPQAFLPDLAMSLNNLGRDLSNLGRREEALEAAQEAVGHYRELAAANPQAFLPDLARSLSAHGSVLLGLGRAQEARKAFGEGLRAILPFAQALPAAFGGLATALREDYLRACREAGEAPEEGLGSD